MAWCSSLRPGNGKGEERGLAALFSCVLPREAVRRRLATALLGSVFLHGSLIAFLPSSGKVRPVSNPRRPLSGELHGGRPAGVPPARSATAPPAKAPSPARPQRLAERAASVPTIAPAPAPVVPRYLAEAAPAGPESLPPSATAPRRAFRLRAPLLAVPPPTAWASQAQAAQIHAQRAAAVARRLADLTPALANALPEPVRCQGTADQEFVCTPEVDAPELLAQAVAAAVEAHQLGMASRPFHLELAPGRSLDIDW